jgi:hypothetical protein
LACSTAIFALVPVPQGQRSIAPVQVEGSSKVMGAAGHGDGVATVGVRVVGGARQLGDGDADARVVGVGDLELVLCGAQDQCGGAGDVPASFRQQREPVELADVRDDVEHPAPADVDRHLAERRHVDDGVEVGGEGGDVPEGDLGDLPVPAFRADADETPPALRAGTN